jgi:DNA-binding response OmpR family regulator
VDAGTRVVLVVDDDDTIRGVIRAVLEADHFRVVEAPDGETALSLLGARDGDRPEIVVLDVMMPGIDGIEVCRQIDHGAVRVLMLTARDDPETQQASKDAGAAAFLAKPFSAVELLDAVEALVRS